jgi:hypothetical protein
VAAISIGPKKAIRLDQISERWAVSQYDAKVIIVKKSAVPSIGNMMKV